MMNRLLFLLSFLFLFTSCEKKSDEVIAKTGIELVSVGSIKFGKVIIGEYAEASIRFTNNGPNIITDFNPSSQLTAPFSMTSISTPCSLGSIPVGITCELKIKFAPTTNNSWTQIITIGDKTQETSGKGLDSSGVVEFSTSNFSLGTVIAGETVFQDLVLTNQGNFAVITPLPVSLPLGMTLSRNDCGTFMAPEKVCTLRFSIYKSTVGVTNESFIMRSSDILDYTIGINSTTRPGPPAGTIAFLSPPASMIANGVETQILTTAPIRDQFNNIVEDGQMITILPFNLTLLSPMIQSTVSGQVSFTVRSTTQRGDATITLVGGASGFLRFPLKSGPPVGVITSSGLINTVNANGITQIDFRTNSLTDQFGNVVEDNTPVHFSLSGGGTLQSLTLHTVLGKVQQLITAPTIVGNSTLTVQSGDVLGSSICGYSACGSFTLYFIPSDPSGSIPIVPVNTGIFADPALGISLGEITQTVVNIGPVKDQYNNIVASGTTLNLSLQNGVNVFNTALSTNALGMASFTVAGTGQRGPIKINVSKLTASGSAEVWAYNTTTIRADSPGLPTSAYKLYLSYFSDSSLPDLAGNWGEIKNWGNIDIQDNNFYGDKKKSAPPTLIVRSSPSEGIIHPSTKLPSFTQPCMFSSGNNTFAGRCLIDSFNGSYSSSYQYQFRKTVSDDGGSNMIVENVNSNNLSIHSENIDGCYKVDTQPGSSTLGLLMIMKNISQAQCGVVGGANPFGEGRWNSNPDQGCYAEDTNIFSPSFGMIRFLSSSAIGCGSSSLRDPSGLFMNVGQISIIPSFLKQPARGYISDLDKLLIFGGYAMKPQIDSFGGSISSVSSNKSTWILNKGAGYIFNETESQNVDDILGDYPQSTSFSQTATSNRDLFMFGGLDLRNTITGNSVNYSLSTPHDRFYKYSGNTSKWVSLNPSSDSSILDPEESKSPTSRYQHGMVYIPDNNTLFIASGKTLVTPVGGSPTWINSNDLWSVNLTDPDNLSWKKECFPCGFPANAHNHPLTLNNESQLNPTDLKMTWHPYLQRVMMLWSGTANNLQFFNPFQSGTKSIVSENYSFNSGINNIVDSSMTQIEFNSDLGRTYFYKKSAVQNSTSNVYYWDMDTTQKQYYKVEINLGGASAKNFVRDLSIRMRGYGKISNLTGVFMSGGLSVQIYNHSTNSWEFMASNNASESFMSSNYLNQDYANGVAVNYVGNDGKISLLVYPVGTTSTSSFNEIFIDEVYVSGTF